ncbi:maleylacetoacetate isomerase [Paludibacterium sp. THUN1379]|uniref:maleylacetoacetate isomerase n=1 Tax=Paludibacterium sp. THUN1379 TaxID=3112107 RepID=UPI003090787D|nr:maleylacetoacetate isomerase [Paludibacterium sp. THUN1379]
MQLYTYFRSSAAWRVRIALNLKQLPWQALPVHLLRDGGQQHQAAFRAINPAGTVPTLVTDDGLLIRQSLAIIDYLDEVYPNPPLLPADPAGRARVRALALQIACDIHPLNNLRVLQYLEQVLGQDKPARDQWYRHWVAAGLQALEALLSAEPVGGRFCHGDQPGMADCCLVPQLFNARRFDVPLDGYPRLLAIEAACLPLPAFIAAHPAQQADAES